MVACICENLQLDMIRGMHRETPTDQPRQAVPREVALLLLRLRTALISAALPGVVHVAHLSKQNASAHPDGGLPQLKEGEEVHALILCLLQQSMNPSVQMCGCKPRPLSSPATGNACTTWQGLDACRFQATAN